MVRVKELDDKLSELDSDLKEGQYSDYEVYADTEDELRKNLSKFDLDDEEDYKDDESIQWDGAGWYVAAFYSDGLFFNKLENAIDIEMGQYLTENEYGFPIMNTYEDELNDTLLEYIDEKITSDKRFKDFKRFLITLKIPFDLWNEKFYSEGAEIEDPEYRFETLFQNKNNVFVMDNTWDRGEICDSYFGEMKELYVYVYAKSKKDIEKYFTEEFDNFCEENDIKIQIGLC